MSKKKLLILIFSIFLFFIWFSVFAKSLYGEDIPLKIVDLYSYWWSSDLAKFDESTRSAALKMYDNRLNVKLNIKWNILWGKFISKLNVRWVETIMLDWDISWTFDENAWTFKWTIWWKWRIFANSKMDSLTDRQGFCTQRYISKESIIEWTYDKETKKIKAKVNYCNSSVYVFESFDLLDMISCDEDEVVVDSKCEKISKYCSSDNLVNYNSSTKECYCPAGYKLTNDKTCEEVPEVVMDIKFIWANPPFIADWQEFTINVSIKDWETNNWIPARFAIDYTNSPQKWTITDIKEINIWEYTIIYKTPNIESSKEIWLYDTLYIYYQSKSQWKEVYKTQQLDLATGTPIIVSKPWFQEIKSAVVFQSSTANVNVFTLDSDNNKIPVSDAKIWIVDSLDFEMTDKNWSAKLNTDQDISTNAWASQLEVILQLDPEISAIQQKAANQYKQLIQWERWITSNTIKDFVINFWSYLAKSPSLEVDSYIAWLKRVGYGLLYITESKNLAEDISNQVGASIKTQISDTLDLFEVTDKAKDYLWSKIDTLKDNQLLQNVSSKINDKVSSLSQNFESKIIDSIKIWLKKYAPSFKSERINWLLSKVFGDRDEMIKQWVEKAKSVPEWEVEKLISSYLIDQFDSIIKGNIKQIENMIQSKNFNSATINSDISDAKQNSLNLREKYLKAHQVSYNVSAIKDTATLFNDIFIEAAKITQVRKAQAEAIEKWYKTVRSLFINNVEIYYRFDAYANFMQELQTNVNYSLWVQTAFNTDYSRYQIIPKVYAADELNQDQIIKAMDYRDSQNAISIYQNMKDINDTFLQVYPEDNDLKQLAEKLKQNTDLEQNKLDQLWESTKSILNQIQKEFNQSSSNSLTASEWVVLIIFIAILVLIIVWIKKLIRKLSKKKNKKK